MAKESNTMHKLQRIKLVREFIKTSGRDKKMEQSLVMILLQVEKLISNEDYVKLKKKYNLKNMVDNFYQVFDAFTNEELREIIEFYKTPIGKKLIEQQDVLMAESTVALQNIFQNMYADIQKCQKIA